MKYIYERTFYEEKYPEEEGVKVCEELINECYKGMDYSLTSIRPFQDFKHRAKHEKLYKHVVKALKYYMFDKLKQCLDLLYKHIPVTKHHKQDNDTEINYWFFNVLRCILLRIHNDAKQARKNYKRYLNERKHLTKDCPDYHYDPKRLYDAIDDCKVIGLIDSDDEEEYVEEEEIQRYTPAYSY